MLGCEQEWEFLSRGNKRWGSPRDGREEMGHSSVLHSHQKSRNDPSAHKMQYL